MTRRQTVLTVRSVAVWLAVTAATGLSALTTLSTWHSVQSSAGSAQFSDLLVALCAAGLLLALAWLWVVTTVTVGELLNGRLRTGGGATRRLVLLACGAAMLAGASAPASATGGDGASVLAGLSLPERSVASTSAPARHPDPPAAATPSPTAVTAGHQDNVHVVRPGESLWSIAASHTHPSDVDARWRAIWLANRDLIGPDPDLILPGQQLRLPTPPTEEGSR